MSTFCEYSSKSKRCSKSKKIKNDEECVFNKETNRCAVKKSETTKAKKSKSTTEKKVAVKNTSSKMLTGYKKFYESNNIYQIILNDNNVEYLKNKFGYFDKRAIEHDIDNISLYKDFGIYYNAISLEPSLHDYDKRYKDKIQLYNFLLNTVPKLVPKIKNGDLVFTNVESFINNPGINIVFSKEPVLYIYDYGNLMKLNSMTQAAPIPEYDLFQMMLRDKFFGHLTMKNLYDSYGINEVKKISTSKYEDYKKIKKSDSLKLNEKNFKNYAKSTIEDRNERELANEAEKIERYNKTKDSKKKFDKEWVQKNKDIVKKPFETWLNSKEGKKTIENVMKFKFKSYNHV